MDQRYLSLQKRTYRGSLPLKKRRLVDVSDSPHPLLGFCPTTAFNASSAPAAAAAAASMMMMNSSTSAAPSHHRLALLPELSSDVGVGAASPFSNEKIAALALVAAAAASSQQATTLASSVATSARLPAAATSTVNTANERRTPCSTTKAGGAPSRPGGCHSRTPTSRRASIIGSSTPSSTSNSNSHHQQQDRRFSGAEGETCCQATTTRGRACAFVAVNGTAFCNLHADYTCNLPSRRGGTTSKTEVSVAPPPSVSSEEDLHSSLLSPAEKPHKKRPGRPPKGNRAGNISSSNTNAHRSAHAKRLAEKHAPHPLLSMVPTDQWVGKTVTVATGPMAQRVGQVEKIGNGWVSVRIPGVVGLHNRRSFELYLHAGDDENAAKNKSSSKGQQRIGRKAINCKEVGQEDASLLRCVSREALSPSPPSSRSDEDKNNDGGKVASTAPSSAPPVGHPSPSPHDLGCSTFESSSSGDSPPPRHYSDTSAPQHILETPRAEKELLKAATITPHSIQANHRIVVPSMASPIPSSGISGREKDLAAASKAISPASPRKVYSELPLVQSLLLAQEGSAKKYNMDMLFGTAALERSRRNISKPTRYEDTTILKSPKSKRIRKDDASVEGVTSTEGADDEGSSGSSNK